MQKKKKKKKNKEMGTKERDTCSVVRAIDVSGKTELNAALIYARKKRMKIKQIESKVYLETGGSFSVAMVRYCVGSHLLPWIEHAGDTSLAVNCWHGSPVGLNSAWLGCWACGSFRPALLRDRFVIASPWSLRGAFPRELRTNRGFEPKKSLGRWYLAFRGSV